MKIVVFSLPHAFIELIQTYVAEHGYARASEFFDDTLQEFVDYYSHQDLLNRLLEQDNLSEREQDAFVKFSTFQDREILEKHFQPDHAILRKMREKYSVQLNNSNYILL